MRSVGKCFMLIVSVCCLVWLASRSASNAHCLQVNDDIVAKPQKVDVEALMAKKLQAAQSVLDGVMSVDHELIRQKCVEMIQLSRQAAWKQHVSPGYIQDTVDFVAAAEFLNRMAVDEDSDGVALAFSRLTLTCANCHHHVRTPRTASLFSHRLGTVAMIMTP